MATTLIDLNNNKLTFNNTEIVVHNINNELWFKGNDVANLLGYVDCGGAMKKHIDDEFKITYEKLLTSGAISKPLSNNEKITIYINEYGLYELTLKSKLKIAKEFKYWVCKDLLPQIRKTGSYSIQNDKSLIENNFWSDNNIAGYNDKNVVYIGYVGTHNNEQLFKFGITEQIYTREFEQHNKNFGTFKMVHIEICDNKRIVETIFKKILTSLALSRKQIFNNKNQTELFTVTTQCDLSKIIKLLKNCIDENPLPIVKNLNLELNNLKDKLSVLSKENNELKIKIKELEDIRKIQTEQHNNHITLLVTKELQNSNIEENEIINKVEETTNEIIEEKTIENITNLPDFFDRYTEQGEDSSSNDQYRIKQEDLYEYYCEKCLEPINYVAFNTYIKENLKIETKVCNWYLKSCNTWMGIKIKKEYQRETKLEVYLRNFIENKCKVGKEIYVDTKVFNDALKKYCEEKEPEIEAVKYMGITPAFIKKALFKFGYGYKEWIVEGKKHGYTGLTLNNILTVKESVDKYIEDCCDLSYGHRVKTTILWESYQEYIEKENISISVVRKQFYDCLLNDYKLVRKNITKADIGFVGIKLKKTN